MELYVLLHVVNEGLVTGKIRIFKTREEAEEAKTMLERIFENHYFIIEKHVLL